MNSTFLKLNEMIKKLFSLGVRMFIAYLVIMFALIWGFASCYHSNGILDSQNDTHNDWGTCFYFSVVTWTTLGYGDFKPTEKVRKYAAIEAIMGQVFMGILVGIVVWVALRYFMLGFSEGRHAETLQYFLDYQESNNQEDE